MLPGLREHPVVRTAVRLNERYRDDAGGYLAASIAYYAFMSLFPLLLLGLSVVGFILSSSPDLQDEVRDAVTGSVPGVANLVSRNLETLERARTGAGLIGLAGLLWTGSGVVGAGRNALRRIFRHGPPRAGIARRGRLVVVTVALGVVALGATALASLAVALDAEGLLGVILRIGGPLVAFALDVGLFLVAYRVLSIEDVPWRDLVPGAVFVAVGWTLLKLFGTWYAGTTVENAQNVYGGFAATIGVLVILYLAARLFVYGAELNAVLIEEEGGETMEESGNGRQTPPDEVSTVRLVGQVAGDIGTLVKKEVELARQEIMEALTARLKAVAAFAALGVIALFIVGFLSAAAGAALALVMPTWAALLIVAGGFVVIATAAAAFGLRRLKQPPLTPEQTKQTIKEDVEWARAQLRR